jgi:hypothetical protein
VIKDVIIKRVEDSSAAPGDDPEVITLSAEG